MPDLVLDLDAMDLAASELTALRTEFLGAVEFNRDLGAATGHRRLGGVVDGFASAWNIRREQISDAMLTVAEAAQAISETFSELDAALAKRARGEEG